MSGQAVAAEAAVGFLTVVQLESHGLLGGYLILNSGGRPLEFHCTAPIRPNRAQEILYGPTLEPFLYGEQIGQTLLSAAKSNVPLVCTDQVQVLAAAELVAQPLALLLSDTPQSGEGSKHRIDAAHAGLRPMHTFTVGQHQLALAADRDADRSRVTDALERLGPSFDLAEPFDRIREAIAEAQKGK